MTDKEAVLEGEGKVPRGTSIHGAEPRHGQRHSQWHEKWHITRVWRLTGLSAFAEGLRRAGWAIRRQEAHSSQTRATRTNNATHGGSEEKQGNMVLNKPKYNCSATETPGRRQKASKEFIHQHVKPSFPHRSLPAPQRSNHAARAARTTPPIVPIDNLPADDFAGGGVIGGVIFKVPLMVPRSRSMMAS